MKLNVVILHECTNANQTPKDVIIFAPEEDDINIEETISKFPTLSIDNTNKSTEDNVYCVDNYFNYKELSRYEFYPVLSAFCENEETIFTIELIRGVEEAILLGSGKPLLYDAVLSSMEDEEESSANSLTEKVEEFLSSYAVKTELSEDGDMNNFKDNFIKCAQKHIELLRRTTPSPAPMSSSTPLSSLTKRKVVINFIDPDETDDEPILRPKRPGGRIKQSTEEEISPQLLVDEINNSIGIIIDGRAL